MSKRQPKPSLETLAEKFYQRLQVKNYAATTIKLRREYLTRFLSWCDDRGITSLEEITRDVLLSYQRYLFHYRNARTHQPLKFSTQISLMTPIRGWFSFLLREQLIDNNPASDLDFPKEEQRLPQNILSPDEAELILNQPDVSDPLGLRDRAMLETFYSTAMRRSELIHLDVYDLDTSRGLIMIRQGKGNKDRNVPIGNRALRWVTKYTEDIRPSLVERTNTSTLFVSRRGRPFGASNLSILVREYMKAAGIKKAGSCHLFRHAVATQMLENGASIRSIQAMLGHSEITTTQIYTHISIKHLKDVHSSTHPAEIPRPKDVEDETQ
jgi:integrase/recombinase XerD